MKTSMRTDDIAAEIKAGTSRVHAKEATGTVDFSVTAKLNYQMEYKTKVFRNVTPCTFVDNINMLVKPAASLFFTMLICEYIGKIIRSHCNLTRLINKRVPKHVTVPPDFLMLHISSNRPL
jgi:hypothetical protein